MRIRFTKRSDSRHRLTVERDDGGVSQGKMVPGLGADAIPHDLLHALVEVRLRMARGVYGLVNTGLEIADLLDPARRSGMKREVELNWSEIVTTLLQSEAAYEGVGDDYFRQGLRERCREHGVEEPAISEVDLRELRDAREEYQRRWRDLGVGQTLVVELTAMPQRSLPAG